MDIVQIKYAVYDDFTGIREGEYDSLEAATNAVIETLDHIHHNRNEYCDSAVQGTTTIFMETIRQAPVRTFAISDDGAIEIRKNEGGQGA